MTDEVKVQRIAGHGEERFLGSDVFESSRHTLPPSRRGGTIREEAREIDVYHTTDVCVVGGGPAGCAAAWAAAKAGADVTLVERPSGNRLRRKDRETAGRVPRSRSPRD